MELETTIKDVKYELEMVEGMVNVTAIIDSRLRTFSAPVTTIKQLENISNNVLADREIFKTLSR